MTLFEIFKMALHNLWQRKLRVALNLIGIVVGCVILLMTAAGGSGVHYAIYALFDTSDFARQIEMVSDYGWSQTPPENEITVHGDMSDARRERIRLRLINRWRQENSRKSRRLIDSEVLDQLQQVDHVIEVVPESSFACQASIDGANSVDAHGVGVAIADESLKRRLIAGSMMTDTDQDKILVHEFLAYQLGYRDDQQIENLVGKELVIGYRIDNFKLSMLYQLLSQDEFPRFDNLEKQNELLEQFEKLVGDLDLTTLSEEQKKLFDRLLKGGFSKTDAESLKREQTFKIKGVFRAETEDSMFAIFRRYILDLDADIGFHSSASREIYLESSQQQFFYAAMVKVDSVKHLEAVVEQVRSAGLKAFSALPILEDVDREIQRISWVFYGIALAILLIAAIGISNTLIISVLQRTPEFGIMKALGATDGQVLLMMIFEGILLGLLGAIIAFGVSNLIAIAGHRILETYVESRINQELTGSLFVFSWTSLVAVIGVAVVVCMLASLLPAYRAARLDPVVAMQRT